MDPAQHRTWRWRTAAVALVLLPALATVLLSLVLARGQARSDQARRAMAYATDVLNRTDLTARQVEAGFAALADAHIDANSPCSYEVRAHLQRIDAISPYIQMVGIQQGETVACSSYGWHGPGALRLGPPDYVWQGFEVRLDVRPAFAPDTAFTVASNGRFVALIHPALPVDASIGDRGVTLAVLSASRPETIAVRGDFDPEWRPAPGRLAPGERRIVRFGDVVVAQARSARYDAVAVAALDGQDYSGALARFARVLVPFGLAIGLALGWGLLRVAKAQTSMGVAIRNGLRANQFFIVLQPIVDLGTRRWVGAEVLLRWKRGDGQLVRPDLFIPVAEENGAIVHITARVLELAEPVLSGLVRRGDDLFLSINLSPLDLLDPGTLPRLRRLVERTGAHPKQLHVEVTERGFVDAAAARERVRDIRAAGLCVSIDDFGTGYSSLSELVKLELDTLKIDKTFVDTIGGEQVTSHVAHHIVDMARSLQLDTVAEGIEHEAQATTLREWGVRHGQGWLFSKPLSPEDFLRGVDVQNEDADGLAATGR